MKKRMLAILLALCAVLTLLPFGASAASFQDVKPGAYYYDAVDWAVNHDPQITNGTGSGLFSPDNTCRRCEVVTFLWRAFGAEKMTGENPFQDVKTTDYFYDAVLWAVEKGVTTGTDATHFSPDNPCTREQVATFLWRASEKPSYQLQVSPFADVLDKEHYSFTPILWAYESGVTNGQTANTFGRTAPCTRGQIVTFLYRALANPLPPVETDGKLHFQPKVASKYLTEVFGEQMVVTWYNLVDAVLSGKTEVACPDDHTFNWVVGQFPDKCFPPLKGHIWAVDPDHPVKNGVARFMYDVPYEQLMAEIADFSGMVEEILNEAAKPEYSDFENALGLYNYSEADVVGGVSETDGEHHQWSYIRLNGHDYHIDPTWVLEMNGKLDYFLMTDAQRYAQGGYSKNRFRYVSSYTQDHPYPNYQANDETFAELWNGYFSSLDHENRILRYETEDADGDWTVKTFDYSDF